jgi:hypothetical protein
VRWPTINIPRDACPSWAENLSLPKLTVIDGGNDPV